MTMRRTLTILCWLACTVPCVQGARPLVFVSIPPQRWLLKQLAGPEVTVEMLIQPGETPHGFEPTGRRMAALAGAEAWFTIGLPFEQVLLPKARGARPNLKVIPLHKGIPRRSTASPPPDEDAHDRTHEHDHGGADPHIWLTPQNMAWMATNACRGLSKLFPEQDAAYRQALDELSKRLIALDRELRSELVAVRGRGFWIYHPSWGYFAEAYGLRQMAVEMEGQAPSARHLARLFQAAQRNGVRVIFRDPQHDSGPLRAMARQWGAEIELLDPLAEDWDRNLRACATRIRRSIQPADRHGERH